MRKAAATWGLTGAILVLAGVITDSEILTVVLVGGGLGMTLGALVAPIALALVDR